MYGGDCDAAIAEAAAAVTMYRAKVRRLVLVMRGWACCVLICHQQKRTFGGWRTSSRDFASSLLFFFFFCRNGLLVAGGRAVETSPLLSSEIVKH